MTPFILILSYPMIKSTNKNKKLKNLKSGEIAACQQLTPVMLSYQE
tara:strand:- start:506 stop:643 length:138 start_codon:yes stop_codon:yes gene_type:complete